MALVPLVSIAFRAAALATTAVLLLAACTGTCQGAYAAFDMMPRVAGTTTVPGHPSVRDLLCPDLVLAHLPLASEPRPV